MNMHQRFEPGSAATISIGFGEFVVMIAGLMALNALAIDVMLPGLQEIGAALRVPDENDRQAVLSAYLLAFGLGQLLVGSLSDRFGRRPVLLGGLALYIIAAIVCASAPSFAALLAGRALQGLASAAPRVVVTAVVRDCYSGRKMASVMSLAMMTFMTVPVLAPSIGQLVLMFASWRAIFVLLAAYGVIMALWAWRRLPETLPALSRRSASVRDIASAACNVVTTGQTLGYAVAGGLMFGANFGFVVSAQQVFTQVFGLGRYFPLAFAAVAVTMSLSAFINSRLVGRLGMRTISRRAVAIFTGLAATLLALAVFGLLQLWAFMLLIGGMMFLLGMVFSNFNALAMEPQGSDAGTASSFIGSVTTVMAAVLGYLVGQAYDGTVIPLGTGYLTLGAATLATISFTDRRKLK
jgi:DHA1 family bicyclomycin/chloramphenicol resistance-like MFS transporter